MSSDSIDQEIKDGPNIHEFTENDILFRSPVDIVAYGLLPRAQMKHFPRKADYTLFTAGLGQVVFVDLWDVLKFLKVKREPGYDPIDIQKIAEIVADMIGEESWMHEAVWTAFDEEVASTIAAHLGIVEAREDIEQNALLSYPFGNAMQVISAIAELLKAYFVNARFPLVENMSVYKVGGYKNGIIALQLRTYEELVEEFGDPSTMEDDEDNNGEF